MIKLVPLSKDNLSFLLEIRNQESTRHFLENDSVFSLEECEKWFDTLKFPWFIIKNEENQNVGYFRTNGDEIGCDIHPNYRKNGFARAAYKQYLETKNQATLWVFEDNFAKNLYESLGFKNTGEFKIIRERKYIQMSWNK